MSGFSLGRRALTAGVLACQAWVTAETGYLLLLLGFAAKAYPTRRVRHGSPLRIAVLIPAHDEESVVEACVASLTAQDHPADRRAVIVIADNCADATAARARTAGAAVWERDDPEHPGKGQAVAWALARLLDEDLDIDAVAMVDADCVASRNFLATLDVALRGGAAAVQVAYDVANPEASPSAGLRWAGFALMHRVRPRGRRALGLSADLFGSGMAFRTELLRAHPWQSYSITEDAEYHLQLVRAGIRVAFRDDASVSSPMPTTFQGAREQQLRWESGNANLARQTSRELVFDGVRRGDVHLMHAGFEQLALPQTALLSLNAATTGLAVALRSRRLTRLGLALSAGQALYVVGGLRVAGAPPAVYRALRSAPELVARKLPLLARIGRGRGTTKWTRTERSPV
jgi:cellulose synthase/poly-beta-1,6-N-acetylglucosamine synthase-like glycosyltransferase